MAILTGARIDHVAYTVPNLEEAVQFFVTVLGWTLLRRSAVSDRGEWMHTQVGAPPEASVRLAMLEADEHALVELFEWQGPDLDGTRPRNCDAGGRHLAVRVDDLDAAVSALEAQPDVQLLGEPWRIVEGPSAGSRWIYARTSWGLDIELIERPATSA